MTEVFENTQGIKGRTFLGVEKRSKVFSKMHFKNETRRGRRLIAKAIGELAKEDLSYSTKSWAVRTLASISLRIGSARAIAFCSV